jgi:hypothetical protein
LTTGRKEVAFDHLGLAASLKFWAGDATQHKPTKPSELRNEQNFSRKYLKLSRFRRTRQRNELKGGHHHVITLILQPEAIRP